MSEVVTEVRDTVGLVTLNRPRALNALSLDMIRALTVTLLAWADDPRVQRVAGPRHGARRPVRHLLRLAATSASSTRRCSRGIPGWWISSPRNTRSTT
jgi:Enoyl-CoA hydratase/isomerase